jgi:hypothetical protein
MLVILKKKGKFEVHHHFCVDNDFVPTKETLLKKVKTLVEAIKFANKYCRKEVVEYGYYICDSCLK